MTPRNSSAFCLFDDEPRGGLGQRLARAMTDRRRLVTRWLPGAVLASRVRGAPSARAATKAEARALWVNRFEYASADDIARIMERAAAANFNLVYFQVRGAADAWYRSAIEPCAVGLCGRLGGKPPYDPLEVAVAEGAKRGLEIHAWLNALAGWSSGSEESCALLKQPEGEEPRHLLLQHPDWAVIDKGGHPLTCPNQEEYVYLAPSHTKVRTQLAAVAADIATRYAVRGIHLDRIRLPGKEWSYDQASLKAFGRDPAADPAAWDDFRRGQVNAVVEATFAAMTKVAPTLVLSASVWELYRDRWDWGAVGGYDGYFQDPRAWAKGGYLDVAVPMTYDPITDQRCARADWDCLVDDHVAGIQEATGRHVYAGIAVWNGADQIRRAIEIGRARGVAGFSLYSFGQIEQRNLWSFLANGPFKERTAVPAQPWKAARRASGDGTDEAIGDRGDGSLRVGSWDFGRAPGALGPPPPAATQRVPGPALGEGSRGVLVRGGGRRSGRGVGEDGGSLPRDLGGARGDRGLLPGPLAAPSASGRARTRSLPAQARPRIGRRPLIDKI